MIYFDNNSTTKPSQTIIEGANKVLTDFWANPGSSHSQGEFTHFELSKAKRHVAALLGIESEDSVAFSSGGTHSNQLVIKHITTGVDCAAYLETEHSSVIEAFNDGTSLNHLTIPVDETGIVNLKELELRLSEDECKAVSTQWANSETGVIQPIAEIIEMCRFHKATLHVDAAQVVGKIPLDPKLLEAIDFLTFTAHKMHGPQGVGVIITGNRQPDAVNLFETNHTPNTPGIILLGMVAKTHQFEEQYLSDLRDSFETGLLEKLPELVINGSKETRTPNTTNIQFAGVDGAALVMKLDLAGIACSQISACLKGRPEPSYVLTAMGLSEEAAQSSVRFSFSIFNTQAEVSEAIEIISRSYSELRAQSLLLVS